MADTPWRLLVLGCGSAGKRWIELAIQQGLAVWAYDVKPEARTVAKDLGASPVSDVAAGIRRKPHGVIIATWPKDHVQLALRMVRADIHVLIEKPLSHTLDGIDDLVRECAARPHLAAGVVCNLRYHPTTQTLRKTLEDSRHGRLVSLQLHCGSSLKTWRQENYEDGYGPWKARGGGVSLDAIHEIDLACHLLGQPERSVGLARRTGALAGDSEDVAAFVMSHRAGFSEVHLDYLQPAYRRRATVIGDKGLSDHVYDADPGVWRQTYLANLKAWMAAASGAVMPNPVSEAARTLRIALQPRMAA